MAKWQGKGLQNPHRRFDSAPRLQILLKRKRRIRSSDDQIRRCSVCNANHWSPVNELTPLWDYLGGTNNVDVSSPIGLPFQKRFQLSIEVKVRVCIRSRYRVPRR